MEAGSFLLSRCMLAAKEVALWERNLSTFGKVNGPATYALTGVEVGACQKPQLADYVPAAYWLSG